MEITLDEVVEAEPDLDGEGEGEVEYERREEEESQYEEDYSDELERCSYTPPSDVEVRSRKRSSDELEDAEADEADPDQRLRGGTPPKRARKGERYTGEDRDGVSVKLKLRKRSSEELDDADEDGGGRGGGGGNNNKRVRVDDSSPAESPRTSTTATSDVSSLADEEYSNRDRGRNVMRGSRVSVSEVDLDRLYVLADEED